MLTKKFCIKCWAGLSKKNCYWNDADEEDWDNHKKVICRFNERTISIQNPPPKKCPYKLEHLLKGND
jgi:hypothetical protein